MIVKVCGITTLDDALASVDAGASALGFNFYFKSPRYIDPKAASEITKKVSSVLRVGVFVEEDPLEVIRIMKIAQLDIAQIYRSELPQGVRSWRGRNVDSTFNAQELDDPQPEAFLLDAPAPGLHGGTGHTFDWSLVPSVDRHIVLAGGLDGGNVAQAIRIAQPWGVDACSKLESVPGRKDHRKVREFVEAALGVHV